MIKQGLLGLCIVLGFGVPDKRIEQRTLAADVDIKGTVYYITENLDMQSSSLKGDIQKKLSLTNYGMDPMIDASNPMEPFVFFPNTGKILIMDNQLNISRELSLFQKYFMQPVAFGRANDGNIWILDKNTNTLKKVDREGDVVLESVILTDYDHGVGLQRIFDTGERVMLSDAKDNLFLFDQNVILIRRLDLQHRKLLGTENSLIYLEDLGYIVQKKLSEDFKILQTDTLQQLQDSLAPLRHTGKYLLKKSKGSLTLQQNY